VHLPFFYCIQEKEQEVFQVNANRRILLYGNSVILGSIGAGLRCCPEFEVETITTPLRDSPAVYSAEYDILLFDLEAPRPEAPFFLLKTHPDLVMVGLSPGTNLVRGWNSRRWRDMSIRGLLGLIKNEGSERPKHRLNRRSYEKIGSKI
jgi:hypothetical protein